MKRKLVSLGLATVMVKASMRAMPVFASDDTATEETTDETTDEATDETADETPEANPELADKKVGVCIYQFSDNFMTLFRGELESYLEKITSQFRMVRMTRLHSPTRLMLSSLTA